ARPPSPPAPSAGSLPPVGPAPARVTTYQNCSVFAEAAGVNSRPCDYCGRTTSLRSSPRKRGPRFSIRLDSRLRGNERRRVRRNERRRETRTRCAPSPHRGEGGDEGGRADREPIPPHPDAGRTGEAAARVCGAVDVLIPRRAGGGRP